MESAITLNSNLPGPTITILGGIHGNERCGINAINRILPELKINKGIVHFIFGNPRAISANSRFIEQNLNRLFRDNLTSEEKKSHEFQRALYIKQFLDQSDICLDLHSNYTQLATPFAFSESNAAAMTKFLPVKTICQNVDAFAPGSTDGYMFNQGKIGICLESGNLEDPHSDEIAYQSIWAALGALNMTNQINLPHPLNQQNFRIFDIYHTKSANFLLTQPWTDFQKITSGTIIGKDNKINITATQDCHILFARNRQQTGSEAFLLAHKI